MDNITITNDILKVDQAFRDGKKVIVQVAPAVRSAISEAFGKELGTSEIGKMFSALKKLGFYRVFDVNFGADLTITEEATELVNRLKNNSTLPQITSCCPGWIKFMELMYSDLIEHVSSCKSPHHMGGAIIKSYFAQKHNLSPKDIFVVSVVPCVVKKEEIKRPENKTTDFVDVDVAITTRELVTMINRSGIKWDDLPDGQPDDDLIGQYSGAGAIFGVTGGVMEAALRTAYYQLTGKEATEDLFKDVRGLQGIKESTVKINDKEIKVAVVSGLNNAKKILQDIRDKKSPYTFIEIMACPGGCINGAGQPFIKKEEDRSIYREKRMAVLYQEDKNKAIRQSHNNEDIKTLYRDFLQFPCSEISHKLLHTTYRKKK